MGCKVSVQIHPVREDLPEVGEEQKATETPLVRKDSSDSYITINLDDDSKVYI